MVSQTQHPNDQIHKDRQPLLAWVLLVVSIADIVTSFRLFWLGSIWQTNLSLITSTLAFLLVTIGIISLYRNSNHKAIKFFIFSVVLRGTFLGILFINIGLPMQIFMLVVSTIVLLEWSTPINVTKAILYVGLASLLSLSADLLQPSWRLQGLIDSSTITIITIFSILAIFLLVSLRSFPKYSIQAKLIMAFLALTGLSVLALSYATYYFSSKSVTEEARFSLQSASQGLAVRIDNLIRTHLDLIQSEAASPELSELLALQDRDRIGSNLERQVYRLLEEFSDRNSMFVESYALMDITGKSIADTFTDKKEAKSEKTYFIVPRANGIPYVSHVSISEASDNLVIYFSAPVRNIDQNIIGVLRVRYKLDIIQSLVAEANEQGGERGYGVLLDEYDIILAHGREPELINRTITSLEPQTLQNLQNNFRLPLTTTPLDYPKLQTLLKDNSEGGFFTGDLLASRTEPGAVFVTPLRYQTWMVAYFQPQQAFLTPVRTQTNIIILLAEAIALTVVLMGSIAARTFTEPLLKLTSTAKELAQGNLSTKSKIISRDEIGVLANTFNILSTELSSTLGSLERRVEERTRAIETAVNLGRTLSTILDQDELVMDVVNELQRAFLYYHVSIYLLDNKAQKMVLAAGTGDAGKSMREHNYSIPNGRGLIGQVAETGITLSIGDTRNDPTWLSNPMLPNTRAEIVVPILLGPELLGVLDVQQDRVNGLTEQDADLLQLIASQVAITLRNTRYYQQTQRQILLQQNIVSAIEKIQASKSPADALTVAIQEISRFIDHRPTLARIRLLDESLDEATDEIFP